MAQANRLKYKKKWNKKLYFIFYLYLVYKLHINKQENLKSYKDYIISKKKIWNDRMSNLPYTCLFFLKIPKINVLN